MPTILTPTEAQKLLTNLSPGVKLEISKTAEGEIVVSEISEPKTKADILKKKYSHLVDQEITVTEAAEKYDIPRSTIQSWIYRSNYIGFVNEQSHPKTVSEAEIAYCAEIHHRRREAGIGPRAPLLDKNGLPYELKHPELARYRRRKRAQS